MWFRYYCNVMSYLLSFFSQECVSDTSLSYFQSTTLLFRQDAIFSFVCLIVNLFILLFSRSTCILYCSSSNYITFIIYWSFVLLLLLYFQSLHPVVVSDVTGTRSCRILHITVFQLISSCSCAYSSFRRFRPRAPQIRSADSPSLYVS